MNKKPRRAFYLDGDTVVAETDVVRFAVGDDERNLRSDVWTFFDSANKLDFYVTSSLIKIDQKASIHSTRAQFSYTSQMWPQSNKNWIGQYPTSRHIETLDIPPLAAREHFHVITVRLPGIGLRRAGRPARRPKPFVLIPPFGADTCVTLNLVLYEGDWSEFIAPLPGQKAVAALQNNKGRSLIVFLRKERENEPVHFYNQFLSDIRIPNMASELSDDLTIYATHVREPDQPIFITELHNIVRQVHSM